VAQLGLWLVSNSLTVAIYHGIVRCAIGGVNVRAGG
jgi:hypothetical protein